MNHERNEKIRRYKESKEIETSLKELKLAIANSSCDEEVLRDYYLKLIRKFIFSAIDDIISFKTEKEILAYAVKMCKQSKPGATALISQPPQKL